jgi:hypothetical protein
MFVSTPTPYSVLVADNLFEVLQRGESPTRDSWPLTPHHYDQPEEPEIIDLVSSTSESKPPVCESSESESSEYKSDFEEIECLGFVFLQNVLEHFS